MADHAEPIKDPVKPYEGTEAAPVGTAAHHGHHHHDVALQRSTWTTGLFECIAHGWGPCLDATCCTVCVLSQMYNKVYNDRNGKIHWPLCGCLTVAQGLGASVEGLGGLGIASTVFLFTMRRDLRRRYNIHIDHEGAESDLTEDERQREMFPMCGEFGSDLFLALCFTPCLLCQMQREMAVRGDYAGYVMLDSEAQRELSAAAQPTIQQIV